MKTCEMKFEKKKKVKMTTNSKIKKKNEKYKLSYDNYRMIFYNSVFIY